MPGVLLRLTPHRKDSPGRCLSWGKYETQAQEEEEDNKGEFHEDLKEEEEEQEDVEKQKK